MSTNLFWEPVNKNKRTLSKGFKWIMEKRFGDNLYIRFDNSDIHWLTGVRDATEDEISEDAQNLINAINKYGEIAFSKE